jgi:acyl carrier protein
MKEVFERIRQMLADILDVEGDEILPETYIVRELGAESIDLLELAVSLNSGFNVEINDGDIFLSRLRDYVTEAKGKKDDVVLYLLERLPFLKKDRIEEMMPDLEDGPTLKVKDLVSYVEWRQENG